MYKTYDRILGGGGQQKFILCKFLKILMVSEKKQITRLLHELIFFLFKQNPLDNFLIFNFFTKILLGYDYKCF